MRIALIHHSDDLSNDYGAYLATLLDATAEEKGYSIKDYNHMVRARESLKEENVLLHIIIPATSNFSLKYWYKAKLSRLFKKYKIDIVFCLYGICADSAIKQVLVFPDKALIHLQKGMLLWQQFAIKRLKESVHIADSIITYSHAAEKILTGFITAATKQITVLPYTAPGLFIPMEWHNKLYIKSRFAENKEYFIAVLPDTDEKNFYRTIEIIFKI